MKSQNQWATVLKRERLASRRAILTGISCLLQKKDVRMLRFIQEVNTTTRSCALWDLDEDTEYIVHVQSISMGGSSPLSEPVFFRTPKESEKMASKSPGDTSVTFYCVCLGSQKHNLFIQRSTRTNKDISSHCIRINACSF